VNLFHGRVHEGHAHIGNAAVQLPDGPEKQDSAVFFARPHEIDILRESPGPSAISAKILDIRSLGATVRIELERDDNQEMVEVEVVRDYFQMQNLREGDCVFLHPKKLRLFSESEGARLPA
jgi:sulfate transport system ATP-binding protein